MDKIKDIILPLVKKVAEKICKLNGGELLTQEHGEEFYFKPTNHVKGYSSRYVIRDELMRCYSNRKNFRYQNTISPSMYDMFKEDEKEQFQDIKIEPIVVGDRVLKVPGIGKVYVDYSLHMITEKGKPAIIKNTIDKYVGSDTFKTFGGLYNFSKL